MVFGLLDNRLVSLIISKEERLLGLILTAFIINGISGKIQGTVKEEDTQKPIPYADVVISKTEIGTATDENGHFFILNVLPGSYTVEFSCIGYQTKRIENVVVEIDQTARLEITLKQTPVEISPVTVISKIPKVKKDMVGTTYIVRKEELEILPIDYTMRIIAFQPAVASVDTALHVRGGRATEVLYMIDNVPIVDPQTGDLAINISKGIIDEVIFVPGGFDAEYGRAMSGVINMITTYPADNLRLEAYGKTEKIMPLYFDFGYENYRSLIHLPASQKLKGILSIDIMHTDDWDPRLFKLPHRQRDDYSLYGKYFYAPSGKLTLSVSGAQSRSQFDRHAPGKFKYIYENYRSDMRRGNFQAININFLPDSRKFFNITLSRLFTRRIYGVRNNGPFGVFEDFTFRNYYTYKYPIWGSRNPFGVYTSLFYIDGEYEEYQNKSSLILKTNVSTHLQMHKFHEIIAGAEYTYNDFKNFTYFLSDTLRPITDEYEHTPLEYSLYLQDNIDFRGVYAKVGCRYDYFSSDIEDLQPKIVVSPRLGFSFMVTEKWLFRANIGWYAQPPLYDYMYSYYNLLPLPSYLSPPPVGNPNLEPEKTLSYEIGMQGEIKKNLSATFNAFYKDITNLIGTRFVRALPKNYVSYFNVEFANVKGIEAIFEFENPTYSGKVSYTLSWARGTSSYANEVYELYYRDIIDTTIVLPAREYNLDFDQRHRIFAQGSISLPLQTKLYLFGYIGTGFPYTPPGEEGKTIEKNNLRLTFRRQIDCVISKPFTIGRISLNANLEITNLLDARYEIGAHYTAIPLDSVRKEFFTSFIPMTNFYYSPAADFNHDGLITPAEYYLAFRAAVEATDDWVSANSAPRRARIGIVMNFQ